MRLSCCAIVASAVVLVTGCFNPAPKPGIGCDQEGRCPPGLTCHSDGTCRDGPEIDAPPPDAAPVDCQRDMDCLTAPTCMTAGTCNLATHTCVFGAVDCSMMDDDCNVGVCNASGACVQRPARQGGTCGQVLDCTPFAPCGNFDDAICDSTGTQTRSCTRYTCQSGACTGVTAPDTQACTRSPSENAPCGDMQRRVTDCGACSGASEFGCALNGSQTCTCFDKLCRGDTCQEVPTSCVQTGCAERNEGQLCRRINNGCPGNEPRLLCCAADRTCSDTCGGSC